MPISPSEPRTMCEKFILGRAINIFISYPTVSDLTEILDKDHNVAFSH